MFTLIFTFLYYIKISHNALRFTKDIPAIIVMHSKLANSDVNDGSSSTHSCSIDVQEIQPSNFNYIFIHINNKIDNKQ